MLGVVTFGELVGAGEIRQGGHMLRDSCDQGQERRAGENQGRVYHKLLRKLWVARGFADTTFMRLRSFTSTPSRNQYQC